MENYKEKYEDALERARVWKEKSGMPVDKQGILDDIFPELKESDDEKIKNEIIDYLKGFIPHHNDDLVAKSKLWIAWLEKQGEQSHCNGEVNDEALQQQLQIWFNKGKCSGRDEVIFHPENFGLQKQCEQRIISKTEPIVEGLTTEFQKQVSHLIASAINKEHEYNEDFVKWTANTLLNYAKQELEKQGEQKPAWSEEDENILNEFVASLKYSHEQGYNRQINCLKSLKNRVQPQPKQEWSEEEKARIDKIIDVLDWAEEKGHIHHSDWEDYVCYVKSLKPQNTWKPSDAQMQALEKVRVLLHSPNIWDESNPILYQYEELMRDLIKLREE